LERKFDLNFSLICFTNCHSFRTGTKLVTTLLHELERRRARYGMVSICEGGGTANALILERLDANARL
jgi:acetyl-CoA acetyltransferase